MSTDSTPTYPGQCTSNGTPSSPFTRQMIAYIPDTDIYGNSTHGVVATGAGPTVSGGLVTRDNWMYQVNPQCSSDPTVNPSCKYMRDLCANYPLLGIGSNK